MGTIIKGGTVVTATDTQRADVRIDGEIISQVAKNIKPGPSDKVIDAKGKLVIPGGIDPHVHLELPFMGTVSRDDFEYGSRAAIAGGTTCFIDFAIPYKNEDPWEILKVWDKKSQGKSLCDYTYHLAVTVWNNKTAYYMEKALEEYGINSFKIFMAYRGVLGVNDDELFRVLLHAQKIGGIVTSHAVNGDVLTVLAEKFVSEGNYGPLYHCLSQPVWCEGEAAGRFLDLARIADCPSYIVHVSCKDSVDKIHEARARGQIAYGESCTQYLTLDQGYCDTKDFSGAKYVLSPPLRPKSNQKPLWDYLRTGTLEVMGTDHCTFNYRDQKKLINKSKKVDSTKDFRQIPNGFNGLEERMVMLYTYGVRKGRISLNRWVEVTSTNAAKIFGLWPKKGTIAVGADADIVIWDKKKKGKISARKHHSRCDYNVYEGFNTIGGAETVLVRGEIAYDQGKYKVDPGHGRFLQRGKFKPLV